LPIVREAAAETAYAAGHYEVALSEFRALRRMSGTHDYLPVMADCERALGRPQAALKLAGEAKLHQLSPDQQVEMTLVTAGARRDLGQESEALRLLQDAIESFTDSGGEARMPKARLRYAYADALAAQGRDEEARSWFLASMKLDPEGETDAQARVDAIDGLLIDFDESDDPGEDLPDPEIRDAETTEPETTEPETTDDDITDAHISAADTTGQVSGEGTPPGGGDPESESGGALRSE
jgi:tetratricopeptide (TPR) repeat protein